MSDPDPDLGLESGSSKVIVNNFKDNIGKPDLEGIN